MAIAPITTTGPTLTVSTREDFDAAYDTLSTQPGGGTILLEPGSYGGFWRYPHGSVDGDQPVVIKSADPDDPARLSSISLRDMTNIRFENLHVEGNPNDLLDLSIKDSSNIQIVDSTFRHDPTGVHKDAGTADSLAHIRDSEDIVFTNNVVDGYFHGLQVTDVKTAEIDGNEFMHIQGDGFRGGGLQDVSISGNYMHDFWGVDQYVTHSDLIQVWGSSSYLLTKNLTISDNILMSGDGAASQSIFIRNEEFGKVGDSTAGYFENITVTNNLIYNGHQHGVRVTDTEGLTIDGNTLLWNPDSWMAFRGGEELSKAPAIVLRNTRDAEVTNNITKYVSAPDNTVEAGNKLVNYNAPDSANHVDNHFVNVTQGGDGDLRDILMLPKSPWYGKVGSDLGLMPTSSDGEVLAIIVADRSAEDQYELTFDAGYSVGPGGTVGAGHTFHWTFADGSTAEGRTVSKLFDGADIETVDLEIRQGGTPVASVTRGFEVFTKDIFAFNFEDGAVDVSDGDVAVGAKGSLVDGDDGKAYLIGDGRKLEVLRETDSLGSNETFGLALDLEPVGNEQSGVFLNLYKSMTGTITETGKVSFKMKTDQGEYSLTSREPIFDDGEAHRIGIAFNGTSGQLEIFADGESVASAEAWGETLPISYYGMVFGNTFKDSMDARIDNIVMSADPAVAGELAVVEGRKLPDPEPVPPPPEAPETEEPAPGKPADDQTVDVGCSGMTLDNESLEKEDSGFLQKLFDLIFSFFGDSSQNDDAVQLENTEVYVDCGVSLDELLPHASSFLENDSQAVEEIHDDVEDPQLAA
ncbi:MAG: right-handed parallel beta-helix repeat-containing protein [Pseudomonadota bacterium]